MGDCNNCVKQWAPLGILARSDLTKRCRRSGKPSSWRSSGRALRQRRHRMAASASRGRAVRPSNSVSVSGACKPGSRLTLRVVGDAECLLATVDAGGGGVALIAGTGSMAWGRSVNGITARAGGYGFLIDDEGSGYWLAAQALRYVCKAADARQRESHLLAAVLQLLDFSSVDQLIGWCYEASDSRRQIATLAPLVFELYDRDPTAKTIVDAGAKALAELVAAVAVKLDLPLVNLTLACAGSVLLRQPIYVQLLKAELLRRDIIARNFCLIEDPVVGALKLACDAARREQVGYV